jgi:predicted RNA binding protein YcfA (HicA-like mRNA interferase family)
LNRLILIFSVNETTERHFGRDLAKALSALGYRTTRQTGSHLQLSTDEGGQHHVTIPNHNPIKVGTLAGILSDVAAHFGISRNEIIRRLFGA